MTQYTSINMTLCKPDGMTYTYQVKSSISQIFLKGKPPQKYCVKRMTPQGEQQKRDPSLRKNRYIDVVCADQQKDDKISDRL